MVNQKRQISVPLVENILAQPEAIRTAAAYQFGEGHAALFRSGALLQSRRGRLILSGMGGSLFACIPLSHYLAAQGMFAPVIETSELLHSYAAALDQDTTVILVSRSGETVEVTKLLRILRERGATVIGVTNVHGSTLASNATECLVLQSPPDQFVAIQTYTATLIVLLLLGAAVCGEIDSSLYSELETLADSLRVWIPQCLDSSEHWSSFLQSASPLYLLGRGVSLAAVHAGVLLFHEVAKTSALGMEAGNFRHGPVEVVDRRFHAVIFGLHSSTVDLDAALAHDISEMNGIARWLGPAVKEYKATPLCPWPACVSNRFAPAVGTIPMQIAAYRLAEIRGVIPGQFRHAPQVTMSEIGFGGHV
ncbi:MAG: SIS domain-containing protein [Acidobacteriaceae bacterium]|nr:SIS domain-containing protein [Acidobacteriaceae bacterium]MBV9780610.1 SIS domain-containing protein [Acidobacteriaceae bacterium]